MITSVIMPKQGLMMTEGTITNWITGEGGDVVEGEPLFEMETDKLTITIHANASGKLLKIVHGEGDVVPITEVIAYIGEEGDAVPEASAPAVAASAAAVQTGSGAVLSAAPAKTTSPAPEACDRVFASPRARMRADERGVALERICGTGTDGYIIERDVLTCSPAKATPLAKTLAAANGLDLASVTGTGSHGKITKRDVLSAVPPADVFVESEEHLIPFSGMRRVIAKRMLESQQINASAQHLISVDMTNAAALKESYQKKEKHISFNDIIVLAAVRALGEFPMMNASYTDEGILVKDYINIGVAVAVADGLLVPNIKHAERLRLEELSAQIRGLIHKAKNGGLMPDDYACGTFTVSNLGMFHLDSFNPIINVPEAGILGIGAIKKTPAVVGDAIVARPMMSVTLTYDHRVIDGAPAAGFLARVREYLEDPCLML